MKHIDVHVPRARRGALSLAVAAALPFLGLHAQAQPTLGETVISASRTEQALQSAPVGATVIGGDEIRAAGLLDANEALRRLAGVPARASTAGREYTIDLRGYGEAAQQNLVVVIDGVRVSENELASARLSAIPADMIERIEIVRGGASVLWGEGASGGVVHVITRRPAAGGVRGAATLALGSFGARDLQASVEGGSQALSAQARVRQARDEGWRANSAVRQDAAELGLAGTGGSLRWRLSAVRDDDDTRFAGSLSPAQAAANPRQTNNPNDFGVLHTERLSAQADWALGRGWSLAAEWSQRERASDATFVSFGYASQARSTQRQFTPRLTWNGEIGGMAATVLLGHEAQRWRANYQDNFGQNENATQRNDAWFARADLLLPSQTRLVAGLRRERVRKAAVDLFVNYANDDRLDAWELAVNQTLAPGWDAYACAGKSFRLGNVDENRFTAGPLRPMLAWDREAGIKHSRGATQATLRLFTQRSQDEIAFDPILFVNVNQDAIQRRGIEVEGRMALAPGWDVAGSAQFIRARFSGGPNVGRIVPLVPQATLLARLGWQPAAGHRLELALRHRTGAITGGDTANACTRVPSATLADLRYQWTGAAQRGWSVIAALDNLADRVTWSNAFSAGCGFIGVYPEPGRTWRVQARYAF